MREEFWFAYDDDEEGLRGSIVKWVGIIWLQALDG
jgi:hypothetical protein